VPTRPRSRGGDHQRRQVDAEDVEALCRDRGAQLAGPTADVQHQAAHRQQALDQAGALVDVVLGDVARKDVVVLVRHRGIQRVLPLLRIGETEQVFRQQLGDTVAGRERAPAGGALERFGIHGAATIRARQAHARGGRGNDRHLSGAAQYPCRK